MLTLCVAIGSEGRLSTTLATQASVAHFRDQGEIVYEVS